MAGSNAEQGNDEIREPDNSTVDDWLGQRVDRDEELADRLLEESGGDEEEAEQRFDRESEADEWHDTHVQGDGPRRN